MNIIREILLLLILANKTLNENTNNLDEIIDYDKTKQIVQDCLNDVLNLLSVNEHVTHKPKVRLLLVMQSNLNNIVKHKWKEHAKMKNMSVAESIAVPKEIYEFVEEALTYIEVANQNNSRDTINKSRNIEDKSIDFFSDLLNKINNQSITKEDTNKLSLRKPIDQDNQELYRHNQSITKEDTSKLSLRKTLDQDNQELYRHNQSITKEDTSKLILNKPIDQYNIELDREVNQRRMDDGMGIWQPDDPQNNTRRTSGGRPVTVSQYPFMASIHVLGKFSCSGCVVSNFFVITAASCLQPGTIYKANKRPIQVRIGSERADSRGELLPAGEVIFHPGFDPVSLANNLAMIKLKNIQQPERKIPIKKIRIDNLPKGLPKDVVAKGVFILGWGDGMELQKKNNQQLTAAFLHLQSLEDCINIYTTQYVTEKNFCAGLVYRGNSACNGDIGGPAIVLGTLVGIVSFGPPACGSVSDPTVFTKVGFYASWINDVIDEKIPKTALSDRFWLSDQALLDEHSPMLRHSHEEMLILRQLVQELDKPENMLAEAIEEDQEIEDEMKIIFKTSTTVDAAHHILLNKSIILVPGLHIPSVTTEEPDVTPRVTAPLVDIGLPDDIPYDFINQFIPDSAELRYIVHEVLTNGTNFKSNNNNYNKQTEMILLTSLESNENFEYESSDGLSIEVSPERDTSEKLDVEILPKGINVKKKKEEITVFDLGNIQHKFNIEGSKNIRSKNTPKDVWLEVKQLKELQKKKGFTPSNIVKLRTPKASMVKRIQSIYLAQLARKINRIRVSDRD